MTGKIVESVVIAFILSALIIPIVIKVCNKFGWYDSVNARKVHTGKIPRLGSLGFVSAFFVAAVYCAINIDGIIAKDIAAFLISAFIIFSFGVIDDFLDLPAKMKLLVQMVAAFISIANGAVFTNIGTLQLPTFVSYPLSFLWICGIINAYNLIDGVDALCGGLSTLVLGCIGIIYLHTSAMVSSFSFIMVGALLGFLIYNKPKAKIFMGDGGSQFLGFVIAVLPLYGKTGAFECNKAYSMVLLTAIPVLDTIAAMWRRKVNHRSFFSPDRLHLHHKLMNLGLNNVKILILLLSIQLLICADVCVSLLYSNVIACFILTFSWAIIAGLFIILHYLNRKALKKLAIAAEKKNAIAASIG